MEPICRVLFFLSFIFWLSVWFSQVHNLRELCSLQTHEISREYFFPPWKPWKKKRKKGVHLDRVHSPEKMQRPNVDFFSERHLRLNCPRLMSRFSFVLYSLLPQVGVHSTATSRSNFWIKWSMSGIVPYSYFPALRVHSDPQTWFFTVPISAHSCIRVVCVPPNFHLSLRNFSHVSRIEFSD